MNVGRVFVEDNFVKIMEKEIEQHVFSNSVAAGKILGMSNKFYNIIWCIFEVVKSSFISRSYNTQYGLTDTSEMFESVGAHTNLVAAIASHAFWFYQNYAFGEEDTKKAHEDYLYQEAFEAIRLHDLSENVIGDIPDNGDRDDERKNELEMIYYREYMNRMPLDGNRMLSKVLKLLKEMQDQSSETGRLLYLSDKAAALMVVLCLDDTGKSPMMSYDIPGISNRDRLEMDMCDYSKDGACKASEMWTIDWFKMRELSRFDDTGFFTALIVMATLVVNECWYTWRYKDYEK